MAEGQNPLPFGGIGRLLDGLFGQLQAELIGLPGVIQIILGAPEISLVDVHTGTLDFHVSGLHIRYLLEIGIDAGIDIPQYIQTAQRLELVVQIVEEIVEQTFGCNPRLVAVLHCFGR